MRLWGLPEATARYVLDSYVETGYLLHTPDGQYRRVDQHLEVGRAGGA
jgi:hypothetical protein